LAILNGDRPVGGVIAQATNILAIIVDGLLISCARRRMRRTPGAGYWIMIV